jgi:flagellar biosynthesis anti-sigma factor FlgM
MKIQDTYVGGGAPAETGRAQDTQRVERERASQTAAARQPAGGDRVELSTLAGRVSRAMETSAADRGGRVEALRAAYQAGTYRPDALATSRGMVADALAAGSAG